MCATLPHPQNTHIHTHTTSCHWFSATCRRCDVSAAEGVGWGAFREKRQRGGERRSVEAPSGDTTQPAGLGLEENTHFLTAGEKAVPHLCPSDGHQRPGSRSRIQTRAIQRGYLHPQPASGRRCGIYRSDPRARSPVCQERGCTETRVCLHIWSPDDATDRPRRHMWMF